MNSAVKCNHCGASCGSLLVEGHGKPFCCVGCKTVYGILQHAGLGSFYQLDSFPGVKPEQRGYEKEAASFAFLDADDVRKRVLDFTDGKNARVTFSIPAIHCVACVWLLERLHLLHGGIGRSEVNFARKSVSLVFREDQLALSALAGLLVSLGYTPDLSLESLEGRNAARAPRGFFLKLGVAGFCFGNVMLFNIPAYLGLEIADQFSLFFSLLALGLTLPAVMFSAQDYWRSAFIGLKQARLTIDVPIALGMSALFLQSAYDVLTRTGEGYCDSLTGLIFFLLCGKWFQQRSFDALNFERDYKSYFPISIRRIVDGQEQRVPLDELAVGEHIRVGNGELIPCDGQLLSGEALVDYAFVSGESEPMVIEPGELVYAGGRQVGGLIEVETTKAVSQSYLTSLWDQDVFRKDKQKQFQTITDVVGSYFTVVIIFVAAAAAAAWWRVDPAVAIRSFAAVLIIACPCALALSAPFALGNMLRIFARNGFFIKNVGVIERMARINCLVFDKTGTLTSKRGAAAYEGEALSAEQAAMVRAVAMHSVHPVSRRIVDSLVEESSPIPVEQFAEVAGQGISASVSGQVVRIGRWSFAVECDDDRPGTWVVIDGTPLGCFKMSHHERAGLNELLCRLQQRYKMSVLSGDAVGRVADFMTAVPAALTFKARQSPHDKMLEIDALTGDGDRVMMLGDGLNDAGALQQSEVGVAVTEDVQTFSPACDGILRADELTRLDAFMRSAREGMWVVYASFGLSFTYNVVGIGWAVSGKLSPVFAAILMPVSSVTVVAFALFATRMVARRNQLETAWVR